MLQDGAVSILKFENDKGNHGVSLSRPASVQRALSASVHQIPSFNNIVWYKFDIYVLENENWYTKLRAYSWLPDNCNIYRSEKEMT